MANPALAYAEVTLGVHLCYDAAVLAHSQLDEVVTDLDKAHDQRRTITEQVADREADLLIAERGKHSDMSATALDQHMKTVKRKDTMLTELRNQLNIVQGSINGLEYDSDMLKLRIKIEVARMEELGGYLQYLSAIKQAENLKKLTNPGE